ncbi:MAG: ABC transporter substrate-binding protein [Opitutaceae bacterium]
MRWLLGGCALVGAFLTGCGKIWNNPYPAEKADRTLIHEFFRDRPKHLDPAQSYVENEAWVLFQIYEPLFDYDYLVRPYRLRPNLAAAMPTITSLDERGQPLPPGAPNEQVAYSQYEIKLRPGVRYQPHPAFARDANGQPRYFDLSPEIIADKHSVADFPETGTRELVAADFAYELKRLARPKIHSPVLETFKIIDGMEELIASLQEDVKSGRVDPDGFIDLRDYPLRGVETPDPLTLRIRIKGRYPQFVYWLAMTFAAPIPWEADRFFSQKGMLANNLSLDLWPVGTGPFMVVKHDPSREMLMLKNPNWRGGTYPSEGEPGDQEAGLLADRGRALPLVDGIRWSLEKESIPFWNKFLQGYYDEFSTGKFVLASLDSAVTTAGGNFGVTPEMQARGVTVKSEVEPGLWYFGFNMNDPVWGGQGRDAAAQERARKLRLAASIALDSEEFVQIFFSGLGLPAQGPIPPGLLGNYPGEAGINPYVYEWGNGRPRRKSIDEAKRLLREAGYPNGRDAATGEPLVLALDATDTFKRERLEWIQRKLKAIDVQLLPRTTDFNRFQEKLLQGNNQFLFWGWAADFPDPENFLFLFYGKNAKFPNQGENTSNYANPEFDRMYEQLRIMDLEDPTREALVARMVELLRHDAPWAYAFNDVTLTLSNAWVHNTKPGRIVRSNRQYQRIDGAERDRLVAAWNHPAWWPFPLAAAGIAALGWIMVHYYRSSERARAIARDAA